MTRPRAAVVVLTWNAGELARRAVDSVLASVGVDVELVVVDNASTEVTSRRVLEELEAEGVRLLREPRNTGFARGMNTGYAATGAPLVTLLNCDAVLHPGALAAAAAALAAHPDVGVVAPHVVKLAATGPWRFWEQPEVVTGFDGGALGLDPLGRVTVVAAGSGPRASFKPNGACPIYRRSALEEVVATYGVGPFDPVFDTYGEDVDLAWKCWATGWAIRYEPGVLAGHVRSYASPLERRDKRGRLRVNLVAEPYLNALRHLRADAAAVQVAGTVVRDLGMVAVRLAHGDLSVVADLAAGYRRAARELPRTLRYRRRHREWRRITPAVRAAWR